MKPIAVIGALITIVVALAVVSKLTAPPSAVQTVAPPPPPPKAETEPAKDETGNPEEKPAEEAPTFQANPFDLKRPGPYPKAVLVEERFEFPPMPLGTTNSHVFVVKNEGGAPLKLEKGPLQCKCTMPALKDKEIPPGGQADILLEWKPEAVQAGFEKEAVIWTNDPANSRLALVVAGDVVADDFWQPSDTFNLDQVRQGEERTVKGIIMSRTRDNLEIEKVDQAGNTLKIEYEKADEELLKQNEAKCGYVFNITVPASEDIALIRETITVTVNSATNTHIIWQVFGNRIGPISIVGNGWYSEKQLIQLGHFSAADGIEKKFSLFLLDRGAEDLKVTDVKVDGPVQVSLVKDEKWAGKTNDRYFLTVKYVPGGGIAARASENPLPVVISTNHPKIPVINLNVTYDAD